MGWLARCIRPIQLEAHLRHSEAILNTIGELDTVVAFRGNVTVEPEINYKALIDTYRHGTVAKCVPVNLRVPRMLRRKGCVDLFAHSVIVKPAREGKSVPVGLDH